jgi:hypothetical protein
LRSPISLWSQRYSLWIFIILVALGSLRIVSTYTVFSHTFDEPAHLACGMEWLTQGSYRYEPQHPPLARVAAALGPYLAGEGSHGMADKWDEGLAILYDGGHYRRTLALARLGILPFFWLAAVLVYCWSKRYFGEPGAVLAVLIFTSLPAVLAHAALATTDMALTATVGATYFCAIRWCEQPGLRRSLALGLATGLAVLSKFSAIAFIPVSLLAALAVHLVMARPAPRQLLDDLRLRLLPGCSVMLCSLLVIWAGYRFSFGPVPFAPFPLPFPELFAGIGEVAQHNHAGDPGAYLLGSHRDAGWWYYYLVALSVKTPLALLGLLLCAVPLLWRQAARGLWLALAFSCSILLFCMFSRINLGIRHILPVYLGFSIVAGAAAASLLERERDMRAAGWLAALLLLGLVSASASAHPDYLAYFNALAGPTPERILVDSDLDWGQDLGRLATRLRQLGATEVAFTPEFPADLQAQGFPTVTPFDLRRPSPGWNAARLTVIESIHAANASAFPDTRFWPERLPPTERIGKSIWLWYVPPPTTAAPTVVPTRP